MLALVSEVQNISFLTANMSSFQLFDELSRDGSSRFTLDIKESCATCFNTRLLKVWTNMSLLLYQKPILCLWLYTMTKKPTSRSLLNWYGRTEFRMLIINSFNFYSVTSCYILTRCSTDFPSNSPVKFWCIVAEKNSPWSVAGFHCHAIKK